MKEIIIKNIILHVLLVFFYSLAKSEVSIMPVDKLDTLLLFVGLIVIAPITSNFIYSYRRAQNANAVVWGHLTTFFSMLVVGILFSILDILLVAMVGNVLIFRSSLILFWAAVITFDLADWLMRNSPTGTATRVLPQL